MTFTARTTIATVAVICAAVTAHVALGAGEPKNQRPFTGAAERQTASATSPAAVTRNASGEPKNEWPFTRLVERQAASATSPATVTPAIAGEPKNDVPFIRDASRTPVLVQTGDGFDWGDAGIGAAVVFGLGCAGVGALAVRAGTARRPRATA
jgi:hypothetical protein